MTNMKPTYDVGSIKEEEFLWCPERLNQHRRFGCHRRLTDN